MATWPENDSTMQEAIEQALTALDPDRDTWPTGDQVAAILSVARNSTATFWLEPGREFPLEGLDGVLYEKCAHCHLMVEDQRPVPDGIAEYIHLSRGDDLDERYEDHEPKPSGMVATLRTWMVYGPDLMRERFHIK